MHTILPVVALLLAGAGCEGGTQLTGVHCEPGTLACEGNTAVRCDETGDRWNTIVLCPPDLECQAGVCVDTHAARCGDGECRAGAETCTSCPSDCACTTESVCLGGACVPRSTLVCGDGLCTADETCDSCTEDCACAAGTACRGGTCTTDSACGDGACGADENCLVCAADCGCAAGMLCRAGSCVPEPEPISVAALRSELTDFPTRNAFDDIQRDAARFGDIPIRVDVVALAFDGITHADLVALAPDVLVLANVWRRTDWGWDLTRGEIEAIVEYLASGHGFIATGYKTLSLIPDLSDIVGLVATTDSTSDCFGPHPILVRMQVPDHPILREIPNPFEVEPCSSLADWRISGDGDIVPVALFADCSVLDGTYSSGGIVARSGGALGPGRSVLFTFAPDFADDDGSRATETDRRLLYNAVVWAAGRS